MALTTLTVAENWRRWGGVGAVALTLAIATGFSVAGANEGEKAVNSIDWATLQRPDSPNTWLVAPPGFTRAAPDAPAPEVAVDAPRVAQAWIDVVRAQRRTAVVGISADGLQVEAEQRSAVFGFVDDISFRAIPLAAGRSTLAVYSRAREGYWDLGVNRRRVRAWLAALSDRLAASTPPTD